jgi:hypothetical protein
MYQDPEEDETVNFTMNADFIESRAPFEYADGRYALIYSTCFTDQVENAVTF